MHCRLLTHTLSSASLALGLFSTSIATAQHMGAPEKRFPADAVIDLSQPPYEAKPSDGKDDTAALQRAISDHVDSGRFLYLPAGVYEISKPLEARDHEGHWRAHLTLQGAGPGQTILKLKDDAEDFDNPNQPSAMLATGSHWQAGDGDTGGGNKAFRNYVLDLTMDTGKDNPGAIALAWAVSNWGAVENVTIRSGDNQGVAGISMRRKIPGPGIIQHVAIDGFDVGVDIGDIQYGVTLEHINVRNQRVAGVRTDKNLLHIRKLTSHNAVPAVVSTKRESMVVLIDSELVGEQAKWLAVKCAGDLLIRDTVVKGYPEPAVKCRGEVIPLTNHVANWAGPTVLKTKGAETDFSALIEAEEPPAFWNADLSDWQPVGPRRKGEHDDTAAIQRAIDAGRSTVYFPTNRTYFLSDTVVVHGPVREILGMGSEISLGAAKEPFSNRDKPRPLFRIDSEGEAPVFFRHIFFNAQYPGEVLFENNATAPVVIEHCGGWVGNHGSRRAYQNTARATNQVFVEDVFLPGWEFTNQEVWTRQFNPENYDGDGQSPQVLNDGGQLWILGFKTEGPAPFITTKNGGVTEMLGAYNYVSASANVPPKSVPYVVENAKAKLTFVTENFSNRDYENYLLVEQEDAQSSEFEPSALPVRGHKDSRAVPLFIAEP